MRPSRTGFLRDACMTMSRNACELLWLAGQEVRVSTLLRLLTTLPGDGPPRPDRPWEGPAFAEVVRLAEGRAMGTPDQPRFLELADYFRVGLAELDGDARQTLEHAVIGVLQGIVIAERPRG
jgi:hypothetical protein